VCSLTIDDFNITAAGGSEGFWGFFTDGAPVTLGVGDRLSVSTKFSVQNINATSLGADLRFGLFDSKGTRTAANTTGGINSPTFADDPGYATRLAGTAASGTPPFTVHRRVTPTASDPLANVTSTTVAEYQALTVNGGSARAPNGFASDVNFNEWSADYTPAAPVITAQPQPSNLTVQVGGNVTMSVAASGSGLSYRWMKNGAPVVNESATQPTLTLTNVQVADTGSYTAVVSNSGGSTTSTPVQLTVSEGEVAPPPTISAQPVDTTVTQNNGKMVPVTIAAGVADAVDSTPTTRIVAVTGSENVAGDWQITGDLALQVRAKRSGKTSRVYTVTVESRDDAGNVSTRTVAVTVR
jgi:hypothetical protein